MRLLLTMLIFLSSSSQIYTLENKPHTQTSISDYEEYRSFCKKASENNAVFSNFKSAEIIQRIMQHVSFQQGGECLSLIIGRYPHLLTLMPKFHENDEVGNPTTYFYQNFGHFSPTNLRYIKVAGDIEDFFGNMRNKKIIEIGSGYGGQCKILFDLFDDISVTLVDLPEPLALAKRYLQNFGLSNFQTKTANELNNEEVADLVISNYAFSECSKKIQDLYLNKIISKSKAGYMIYNSISSKMNVDSYTPNQVINLLSSYGFSVYLLKEEPLTHKDNCLIVWKK